METQETKKFYTQASKEVICFNHILGFFSRQPGM